MKKVYKLSLSNEERDIKIGYYSSRNKALEDAEHMIGRSGQRVMVKRKRHGTTVVVGDQGAYYVIETIWVE